MCEHAAQVPFGVVRTWDHTGPVPFPRVGRLSPEEAAARGNITRWLLYLRETFYVRADKPDIKMAKDLGISRSLISGVLAGEKQVGFDVAMKMRTFFKRTLDELVYTAPPGQERPDLPHRRASIQPPARKRGTRGGNG